MNNLTTITPKRRILLICYLILFLLCALASAGEIAAALMYWFSITIPCAVIWLLISGHTVQDVDSQRAEIAAASPENRLDNPSPQISQVKTKPFWKTWLKCTGWIFLSYCVFGFAANGSSGLAAGFGGGLILAPIKGAILAAIIRWYRAK
jgi:hypothetical protein